MAQSDNLRVTIHVWQITIPLWLAPYGKLASLFIIVQQASARDFAYLLLKDTQGRRFISRALALITNNKVLKLQVGGKEAFVILQLHLGAGW